MCDICIQGSFNKEFKITALDVAPKSALKPKTKMK